MRNTWVIPKSKDPGPGSYKVEEAIKRGTWAAVKGPYKGIDKKVSFFDEHKKKYLHIPGPGKNKNEITKFMARDTNYKMVRH